MCSSFVCRIYRKLLYINITLHAQIQHTENYSPLYPPVSESVIIYAWSAIIALMDEWIYEINRILHLLGYEIK